MKDATPATTTYIVLADDRISGYGLAKKVNEVLASHSLKQIPPQMIYNYMNNGLIKTHDHEGQRMIMKEEAIRWSEKYIAKRIRKG